MRVLRYVLLATLAVGVTSSVASASSFTFATAPGATELSAGLPVNAMTTITTGTNSITVTLSNLQANPTSVAQIITDLFFTLNSSTAGTTITSSAGLEITVAGNGTIVPGAVVATGWNLDLTNGPGSIHLCTIGPSPCGGGVSPAHGIIGPPNGSGIYSNANGSIAGNLPHNPFLSQTATFSLFVPGVTDQTLVTSAVFSFNTTAGDNVPGTPRQPLPSVPEPASLTLLGTGLAYLSSRMRRR